MKLQKLEQTWIDRIHAKRDPFTNIMFDNLNQTIEDIVNNPEVLSAVADKLIERGVLK